MMYKVWHIPQVPGKAFEFQTESLIEANTVKNVLADYDLFQFAHRIKPDYANAQGIAEWNAEENDWFDIDEENVDLD